MKRFLILLVFGLLLCGCKNKLPVIDDWGANKYNLVNQNSKPVIFPDFVKGKIVVMNYIFTRKNQSETNERITQLNENISICS